MRLFRCQSKEDKRDTWYELHLDNGNKMGIVYRGYGQMEFWGGYLAADATRTLLYDTDLSRLIDALSEGIHTLFVSAVGEKEYTSNSVTPLWFTIINLMSIMERIEEYAPGLFGNLKFDGYKDKLNQLMLDMQKLAGDIKIIVTSSGENATHASEM